MRIVELRGSYHQIGVRDGLKLPGPRTFRAVSGDLCEWALACGDELGRYAPELYSEMSGLLEAAEASGGQREHLLSQVLTPGPEPGCTAVHVGSGLAAPVFGRNYDYRPSARRRAALYLTYPRNAHPHVGFSHRPVGRYGGINAAGLAVATAVVPPRAPRGAVGMTFTLAVRCVLDRHRTVTGACRFLGAIPHIRNVNFLLADGQGDRAVVEAHPGGCAFSTPAASSRRSPTIFSPSRRRTPGPAWRGAGHGLRPCVSSHNVHLP